MPENSLTIWPPSRDSITINLIFAPCSTNIIRHPLFVSEYTTKTGVLNLTLMVLNLPLSRYLYRTTLTGVIQHQILELHNSILHLVLQSNPTYGVKINSTFGVTIQFLLWC